MLRVVWGTRMVFSNPTHAHGSIFPGEPKELGQGMHGMYTQVFMAYWHGPVSMAGEHGNILTSKPKELGQGRHIRQGCFLACNIAQL